MVLPSVSGREPRPQVTPKHLLTRKRYYLGGIRCAPIAPVECPYGHTYYTASKQLETMLSSDCTYIGERRGSADDVFQEHL